MQPRADQRIVRDGKVRTAAGVSAGIDLALALVAELEGEEAARVVQLVIEYDPQPPFDSGHASKASAETKARALAALGRASLSADELLALPKALVARWRDVLYRRVRGLPAVP